MTMPQPPYPAVDNPVLTDVVRQALLKFESGDVSVAGAIMAAAQSTWAIGHQEGEDLCVGCAHRVLEHMPKRSSPHLQCVTISIALLEQSLKTYIDTWMMLAKAGKIRFPQTEAEMRGAFSGLTHTFLALRLLAEEAAKRKGQ
jgi:hypothetical protein